MILDYVVEIMREWRPKFKLVGLSQVKFVLPIRPGERFRVQLSQTNPTNIRFSCYVDNDAAVKGFMDIQETQ